MPGDRVGHQQAADGEGVAAMWRARRLGTSVGSEVRPGGAANIDVAHIGAVRGGWAGRRGPLGCAAWLALALALVAVGCGANNKANTSNTPINGRTVTYALPAGITPNYIFPFAPSTVFTVANLDNLSYF